MVACNHNPKRIRRLRLACATWRNPVTKEPNHSGLNPLQRLYRVSSTIHKLIALSPPALIGKLRLKAVNVPSFHRGQKLLPGPNPAFYCLHLRVPSKEEDFPGLTLQYWKARVPAHRETLTLSQRRTIFHHKPVHSEDTYSCFGC